MEDETVDHVARQMGQRALDKIEGHEKLCTERWDNVRHILKGINSRQWWMITALVAGQGAVLLILWNALNVST